MPRGPMSPAARARIAAAQRKRWAAHRAAKAAGTATVGKKKRGRPAGPTTAKRRGRAPKAATSSGHNPFMDMTVHALAVAKRNIDEAWEMTLAFLQANLPKARGGRRRKK